MKRLRWVVLVVAVGGIGLTIAASATGTAAKNAPQTRHVQGAIESLAIDGDRVAYDVGSTLGKANNRVVVWNVHTGTTTTVSGTHTRLADGTSTGSGVFQLAIAGTHVAWMVNLGGNLEGDDYLYSSSVSKPEEHQIATAMRSGDNCPGRQFNCRGGWLGGLVGSGNLIAANRWTTDALGSVTSGGLYELDGTTLNQMAAGSDTVEARSADAGRVAVLRSDGTVGLYSSGGLLRTVTPSSAADVAWSGHQLVVLTKTRTLEIFYSPSGTFQRSVPVPAGHKTGNLDVQGVVAIYSAGSTVHAINVLTGKDRVIGKLAGAIGLARIDSAGVVYSSSRFASKGTVVFVPLARVAAAVR